VRRNDEAIPFAQEPINKLAWDCFAKALQGLQLTIHVWLMQGRVIKRLNKNKNVIPLLCKERDRGLGYADRKIS
jgi:hypothetical protein